MQTADWLKYINSDEGKLALAESENTHNAARRELDRYFAEHPEAMALMVAWHDGFAGCVAESEGQACCIDILSGKYEDD